jgi:hypothetical protein
VDFLSSIDPDLTKYSAGTYYYTKTKSVIDINAGVELIELPIEMIVGPHYLISHTFVDGAGVATLPSAGTITIRGKTVVNPDYSEEIAYGTNIDATLDPMDLSVGANLIGLEISGSGIVGATSVVIRISGNIS